MLRFLQAGDWIQCFLSAMAFLYINIELIEIKIKTHLQSIQGKQGAWVCVYKAYLHTT